MLPRRYQSPVDRVDLEKLSLSTSEAQTRSFARKLDSLDTKRSTDVLKKEASYRTHQPPSSLSYQNTPMR